LEFLNDIILRADNFLWSYILVVLLVGTGLYLTIRMRGVQVWGVMHGTKITAGYYDNPEDEGDLSHFQALSTALSATVGIGNIAGVAIAIQNGGPGALFWMWVTAAVGMATKFTSCTLAVKFRKINPDGSVSGGPMYFMEQALGWKKWAVAFAILAGVGSFGAGCMAQAGELARAFSAFIDRQVMVTQNIDLVRFGVGVFMALMVGLVIIGGIKRIGQVASRLVPFMGIFYVTAALVIIVLNFRALPQAIVTIFHDAFTGTAATGGFFGATFIMAMQWGVRRGLFSNESGQGTAPIAHATAKTPYPVREGYVALLGPFIDTIIICTMTGLVVILTGAWTGDPEIGGADLTAGAFKRGLAIIHPSLGETEAGRVIVTFGVILFAYSTTISWSYYGDRCVSYLFGLKAVMPYRYIFCLMLIVGATIKIDLVWNLCDIMNGGMAIPNLIALIFLSGVVAKELRNYNKRIPEFDREVQTRRIQGL
jgi:AGCS family alanine or glycine:cation symporter